MSRLARLFGASDQRLRAVEQRLDDQRTEFDRQRADLAQQQEQMRRQRKQWRDLVDDQDAMRTDLLQLMTVYPVLEQQMSSIETRLQQLVEQTAPVRVEARDTDQAVALNLLDEVRQEHSRIRVRFGVVSRYEERLRRLEAALKPTPDQVASAAAATSPEQQDG